MQILAAFKSWWRRTFGPAPAVPAGTGLPEPLERRALVIISTRGGPKITVR
jgi:hypothetical protein